MINELDKIGRNVNVSFGKRAIDVPAKVDTGADSSSVWASKIRVGRDGVLRFALFGEGSPYYNGRIFKRTDFRVAMILSASGHQQIRYRTHFTININGRKIRALFNLSDRSKNAFPVLIGRRTISGKFLVDVTRADHANRAGIVTKNLNSKLKRNPVLFHNKYYKDRTV